MLKIQFQNLDLYAKKAKLKTIHEIENEMMIEFSTNQEPIEAPHRSIRFYQMKKSLRWWRMDGWRVILLIKTSFSIMSLSNKRTQFIIIPPKIDVVLNYINGPARDPTFKWSEHFNRILLFKNNFFFLILLSTGTQWSFKVDFQQNQTKNIWFFSGYS